MTGTTRIVGITVAEDLSGAVSQQTFLAIPDTLDLKHEESQWFASGGDSNGSFVDWLKAKGAVDTAVEIWHIGYY